MVEVAPAGRPGANFLSPTSFRREICEVRGCRIPSVQGLYRPEGMGMGIGQERAGGSEMVGEKKTQRVARKAGKVSVKKKAGETQQ